ncbi:MAG TPA: hypothetical protein VH986_08965 [Acidimicrobiia bacterium]|jgi:hypothetical protein
MSEDEVPGALIVRAGWVANGLFLVTAVPAALAGSDTVDAVAIAVALLLFFVGIGMFVYAFAVAVARTTRGDNVVVANLFFLQGSAPRSIQRAFLVQFLVALVIAGATATWEPFGVLVPILPIALAGTWAARHGTFPPRPVRRPGR